MNDPRASERTAIAALDPLISRIELRAALQPRKQLRIRRLFNIEREQIALFLEEPRREFHQTLCSPRQLSQPRVCGKRQSLLRDAKPVVVVNAMRRMGCVARNRLLHLGLRPSIDIVRDAGVPHPAIAKIMRPHRSRFVQRYASCTHSSAHQQTVARFEGEYALPRHPVHLQQRTMRRRTMMQPGMHNAVVERAIRKAQRLRILKAPCARRKLVSTESDIKVRDSDRRESLVNQCVAVEVSAA